MCTEIDAYIGERKSINSWKCIKIVKPYKKKVDDIMIPMDNTQIIFNILKSKMHVIHLLKHIVV